MIVADTSVWIEFLKRRESFFSQLDALLRQRQIVAIECIFGELLQGAKSKDEFGIIEAYWKNLPKIEEEGIWLAGGLLSYQEKLFSKGIGLIDLAILGAARKHQLKIWSLDKKFNALLKPEETFVPS